MWVFEDLQSELSVLFLHVKKTYFRNKEKSILKAKGFIIFF